jgi:hypothetical protein
LSKLKEKAPDPIKINPQNGPKKQKYNANEQKNQNIYKALLSTFIMTNKDLNEHKIGLRLKSETIIVKGTITTEQRSVVQSLIGIIGSNEQDVVGKILTLWLYNEGFLNSKKVLKSKNADASIQKA